MKKGLTFVHFIIAAAAVGAFAQEGKDRRDKLVPLFQIEEEIELEIHGNFPAVNKSGAPQDKPSPGKVVYMDDGARIELDIELEARGGGRSWWCNFAPMKLRLPGEEVDGKSPLKDTIFRYSKRSLRLVTHCLSNDFVPDDKHWDSVVLTEHLSYQILIAAGLPALETQMVRATYYDNAGKKFQEGNLLILENAGDMAQRMGLEEIEDVPLNMPESARVPYELALRLISSERDHWFKNSKNSFFAGIPGESSTYVQIPYDFVYSPREFPFSPRDVHHEKGWFEQYENKHKMLSDEIVRWARIILSNEENIMTLIDNASYPEGATQAESLKRWISQYLDDAREYLSKRQ